MKKENLLKQISEAGYTVGYGAKRSFATNNIVEKLPGLINIISVAVGIFSLTYKSLSIEWISSIFLILAFISLYIERYSPKEYLSSGEELTKILNSLKRLYYNVKNENDDNLEKYSNELFILEESSHKHFIGKQILFSHEWAHYLFFWQHQTEWMNEQLNFNLIRDKLPLTVTIALTFLISTFIYHIVNYTISLFNLCI